HILKNLTLKDIDVVAYCKEFLKYPDMGTTLQGKNWYAKRDKIIFTNNAYSYTIITAHIAK
ncbi:MAG: DUF3781 domain-containing protein, partial [Roseburia sp.]|nr:DUF3781 domain-containing protein [Roseburia sp.]